jgi:uncharacterized protein YnzC (UPF0291/DUF896 family)
VLMADVSSHNVLDRILDPLAECLTPDVARRIVAIRVDREVQARIDELADKNTSGQISEEELAEYDTYIQAIDFITFLQAKARTLLEHTAPS